MFTVTPDEETHAEKKDVEEKHEDERDEETVNDDEKHEEKHEEKQEDKSKEHEKPDVKHDEAKEATLKALLERSRTAKYLKKSLGREKNIRTRLNLKERQKRTRIILGQDSKSILLPAMDDGRIKSNDQGDDELLQTIFYTNCQLYLLVSFVFKLSSLDNIQELFI